MVTKDATTNTLSAAKGRDDRHNTERYVALLEQFEREDEF